MSDIEIHNGVGSVRVQGDGKVTIDPGTGALAFYSHTATGATQQTITGIRASNTALASLLTALAALGLIVDSTTAT